MSQIPKNKHLSLLSFEAFKHPYIISASRRTDIPAFYGKRFLECVINGFVELKHPFNHKKMIIDLSPSRVAAIVFWSKNFTPFLSILKSIDSIYNKRFLFHFTINNFKGKAKSIFEPVIPELKENIDCALSISENYPSSLIWRFDPIFFSNLTPPTERLEAFSEIAEKLQGKVQRCIISFVDLYNKVNRRFQKIQAQENFYLISEAPEKIVQFVQELKTIATKFNISLQTCCENWVAKMAQIEQGHCIDAPLLKKLYPEIEFTTQIQPTRPECGCYFSIDIGTYNTCLHRCLYCYANR